MLYQSKQWIEDIDTVIHSVIDLRCMQGKSILITGATGLICSAVVDILLRFNDMHEKKIQIYAAGRNKESFRQRYGNMIDREDFHFVQYDAVLSENSFDFHSEYIIHGAGNAYPSRVMEEPVETMLGNFLGLKGLLDYAKETDVKRVLYISSSEVYGKRKNGDNKPYCEEDYGYVDLLNPRNSYPIGKRAAETLCISYQAEYGIDTVIVRPGHVYGPSATQKDTRVSSQWPYAVLRGESIVMKSDGSQIRSYCYCIDCASAILTVLLSGEKGHAYNISNPSSVITIREMAEILANIANVDLKMELPTDEDKRQFNPMNNSSLNGESLMKLGWKGCFGAEVGFEHTVRILEQQLRHM